MQKTENYCDICKSNIPERYSVYNIDISEKKGGIFSSVTQSKSIMCKSCRDRIKLLVDSMTK